MNVFLQRLENEQEEYLKDQEQSDKDVDCFHCGSNGTVKEEWKRDPFDLIYDGKSSVRHAGGRCAGDDVCPLQRSVDRLARRDAAWRDHSGLR